MLRPRPSQGSWDEDSREVREGSRGSDARRPTDIYVPRRDLGGPATLEFAVTSGLRTDLLEQTVSDVLTCLSAYEHLKNSFLNTAAHCASKGIAFVRIVVEAHSKTWGPAATKVWLRLGKAVSLMSGESTAVELFRARQNLGLTLHRETAERSCIGCQFVLRLRVEMRHRPFSVQRICTGEKTYHNKDNKRILYINGAL